MKELGIEPMLILAQIVNVGVLFFVLNKFLYKPVMNMLDKRKKEIDEAHALSNKLEKEEEKLKSKQDELVSQAKKDAKAIVDQAKKQMEEQKKTILEEAHTQAAQILDKAKAQAKKDVADAKADVAKEAISLAGEMAQKLMADVLSDNDHHKLVAAKMKELEKLVKSN